LTEIIVDIIADIVKIIFNSQGERFSQRCNLSPAGSVVAPIPRKEERKN
jgi:hypothetical protein